MDASDIRCENDMSFYNRLLVHPDVKAVNSMIARHEKEGVQSVRRNLLATSVRLTASMAPDITKMADECISMLGVKLPVELFVYSSPQFNAACFKPRLCQNSKLSYSESSVSIRLFQSSRFE